MSNPVISKRSDKNVHFLRKIRDGFDKNYVFCEGFKLLDELINSSLKVHGIYGSKKNQQKIAGLINQHKWESKPLFFLEPNVMKFVSDLENPPGLIVIAERPSHRPVSNGSATPLILVVDGVQLPQNVGNLFRTCEGAGVTEVWLTQGSVDAFGSKVIRGSMGSVFRIPFEVQPNLNHVIEKCKQRKIQVFMARQDGRQNYSEVNWMAPSALLIGSEGKGFSQDIQDNVNQTIKIPMKGQVESLNIGTAAAICLFEAHRQRRTNDST